MAHVICFISIVVYIIYGLIVLQKVRKQGIRFWDERTFGHEMANCKLYFVFYCKISLLHERNRFSHCIYFLLVYKVFYMSALDHRHLIAVKAATPAHLLQLKSNLL